MPNEWMHVYVTPHTNSRNITYGLIMKFLKPMIMKIVQYALNVYILLMYYFTFNAHVK